MKIFKSRTFSWKEMGLLKACLISLGILLTLYYGEWLYGLEWLWWALFVLPAGYFIIRFFKED